MLFLDQKIAPHCITRLRGKLELKLNFKLSNFEQ
jgi:hypothetical protein